MWREREGEETQLEQNPLVVAMVPTLQVPMVNLQLCLPLTTQVSEPHIGTNIIGHSLVSSGQ